MPESGNLQEVGYALGLAKMKIDRFVSLAASDAREGVLVTRAPKPKGCQLVVNGRCRERGYIQAEIADADGKVLDGFERASCVPFDSDATAHRLRWKGRQAIPAREWVKVHFFIKRAELFTFQFTP